MKIVDAHGKKLYWWNKNYFYAGTIFLILLQFILFAALGTGWSTKLVDFSASYDTFSIQNFFNGIFGSFDHVNWQHILTNMLCFFGCGLYLERKQGTLKFVPFVLALCIFSRMANMLVLFFHSSFLYGFSSCNYALYAVIILDIIFSIKEMKSSKFEIIFSVIILALIYFSMCFCGGTATMSFTYYPYDFIYNSWHWAGFLVGIIVALLLNLHKLFVKKEMKEK